MNAPRLARAAGLALLAACGLLAARASAAPRREIPPASLSLTAEGGGREAELSFDGERFTAAFVLENTGATPAKIVRLGPRAGTDGRLPVGVGVETEGGPLGTLEPGAKRRGIVRWKPGAARELYGTVEAEPEKGPTAPLSVHAERGALERVLTSLLVALPLLVGAVGAALAAAASSARRLLVEALAFASLGVAVVAAARVEGGGAFAVDAAPLAFVERAALGPIEWFVGLSGATAGAIVVIHAAFVGAVALSRQGGPPLGLLGAGLAASGLTGALVAQDGRLLALLLAAGLGGLALALRPAGPAPGGASKGFALVAAGAVALVAFAVASIAKTAPPAPGWAGADAAWSLPDAGMAAWGPRLSAGGVTALGPIAGAGFVKLVALAALLGAGVLLPGPGLCAWLAPVLRAAPRPALALLGGALPPAAGALLVRLGPELLPMGTRWAAPALVWGGALGLVLASLRALRARDLRDLLAAGLSAQGALAFVALGSLVPQGVAAALAGPTVAGAGGLLLALVVAHVEETTGTGSLGVIAGHVREAPTVAGGLVIALAALASLPTSAGASTLALALFGATPRYPALALAVGLAWALFATSILARLFVALRGKTSPELGGSVRLEPFGGRLPELRGGGAGVALLVALALVVLGLWPRPLLSLLDVRALEIHRKLDPPGLLQVS